MGFIFVFTNVTILVNGIKTCYIVKLSERNFLGQKCQGVNLQIQGKNVRVTIYKFRAKMSG